MSVRKASGIQVLGLAGVALDVTPELARATIASVGTGEKGDLGYLLDDLKLLETALACCQAEWDAIDHQMQFLLAESRAETEEGRTSQKTRFADMMARKAEAARRLVDTQQAIVLAKWSEGPRQ